MVEPVKLPSSNRKWIIAVAAVAVVAVAILVAISANGGDKKTATNGGNLAGIDDATALLTDIPQSGLEIGQKNAPATIVEYLDVQCPHCRDAASSTVPALVAQFVKTGKAKLKLQPIAFIGDDSNKGALAVIAAADQNRAGEFAEILFRNQGEENGGWLTDQMIDDISSALKLDTGKLNDARNGSAAKSTFDAIAKAASTDQVQSTPTFVVKGAKGQYTIQNRQNMAEFAQAIAKVQ